MILTSKKPNLDTKSLTTVNADYSIIISDENLKSVAQNVNAIGLLEAMPEAIFYKMLT